MLWRVSCRLLWNLLRKPSLQTTALCHCRLNQRRKSISVTSWRRQGSSFDFISKAPLLQKKLWEPSSISGFNFNYYRIFLTMFVRHLPCGWGADMGGPGRIGSADVPDMGFRMRVGVAWCFWLGRCGFFGGCGVWREAGVGLESRPLGLAETGGLCGADLRGLCGAVWFGFGDACPVLGLAG